MAEQCRDISVQVSAVLSGMGIKHTNECRVFRGVFYIDIAVRHGIAIEVDGGFETNMYTYTQACAHACMHARTCIRYPD